MTSLLDGPSVSELEGVQVPRVLWVPPTVVSTEAGDEAVDLAAVAGLHLDPWQQLVLKHAMAEDARGRWAAFEIGLVVCRQNGKGAILEALELAWLFLLGGKLIIHSAHLFETAMEHFLRLQVLIESNPDFDRRVKRMPKAHGEEGIELKNGQRLKFKTRTKSGGRGLSGDLVVLDEAMILDPRSVGALMPTMSAKAKRGNPQIWYTGSAGDEDAHVLAKIRRRGMAGGDPSLCYAEWSVDEDAYWGDPDGVSVDPRHIAQANPGLNIRLTLEHTLREQRSMDRVEYARERLGIGNWPADPDDDWVISRALWEPLADLSAAPPRPAGKVAFSVDTQPLRQRTSISVAGVRSDGRPQAQVVDNRTGVTWVVARLKQLAEDWDSLGVVVDKQSAAASLLEDLKDAKVDVIEMNTTDAKEAFGQFYDAATDGRLRHLDQPELNAALKGASTRTVGDALLWDRRSAEVDITPLVSATNAL